ncbi:hypothetical protein [Nonomuraea sp. NPDC049758]|uniref:hypothetical protein n=1 Tax=Nonomuraea sp. NPDC049758 TaxID=3154360 RepID=UPI00344690D2
MAALLVLRTNLMCGLCVERAFSPAWITPSTPACLHPVLGNLPITSDNIPIMPNIRTSRARGIPLPVSYVPTAAQFMVIVEASVAAETQRGLGFPAGGGGPLYEVVPAVRE